MNILIYILLGGLTSGYLFLASDLIVGRSNIIQDNPAIALVIGAALSVWFYMTENR